jgi:hypothetical protein
MTLLSDLLLSVSTMLLLARGQIGLLDFIKAYALSLEPAWVVIKYAVQPLSAEIKWLLNVPRALYGFLVPLLVARHFGTCLDQILGLDLVVPIVKQLAQMFVQDLCLLLNFRFNLILQVPFQLQFSLVLKLPIVLRSVSRLRGLIDRLSPNLFQSHQLQIMFWNIYNLLLLPQNK